MADAENTTESTENENNASAEHSEGSVGNENNETEGQETETKEEPKTFTQEELNEIISGRVNETRESVKKEFADYAELKAASEKLPKYEEELNDIKSKYSGTVAERDRLKIALEYGFNEDTLDLIKGDNFEDLKASAEKLQKVINDRSTSKTPFHQPKEYVNISAETNPYAATVQAHRNRNKS